MRTRLESRKTRALFSGLAPLAILPVAFCGALFSFVFVLVLNDSLSQTMTGRQVVFHVAWVAYGVIFLAAIRVYAVLQMRRRRRLMMSLPTGTMHYYQQYAGSNAHGDSDGQTEPASRNLDGEERVLCLGELSRKWLVVHILDSGLTIILFLVAGFVFWRQENIAGVGHFWLVVWFGWGLGLLAWRWLSLVWWGVTVNPEGVRIEPLWGTKKFIPWQEGSFLLVSSGLSTFFTIESPVASILIRAPRGTMDDLMMFEGVQTSG